MKALAGPGTGLRDNRPGGLIGVAADHAKFTWGEWNTKLPRDVLGGNGTGSRHLVP
jgi:hypothetical protein